MGVSLWWLLLLWSMGLVVPQHRDLPGPETEPVSSALAGRFLTAGPAGKPSMFTLNSQKEQSGDESSLSSNPSPLREGCSPLREGRTGKRRCPRAAGQPPLCILRQGLRSALTVSYTRHLWPGCCHWNHVKRWVGSMGASWQNAEEVGTEHQGASKRKQSHYIG